MDPRTPVLVGVGAVSDHSSVIELMAGALLLALDDAGAPALGGAIDRIAVPQGSWAIDDPARTVAAAVGASEATTHLYELGIPQQTMINDALSAILDGRSEVAVIVGGEDRAWARKRGPDRALSSEGDPRPSGPDVLHRRGEGLVEPVEVSTGLWEPVRQYAMIDNALRYAEAQSLAEHRRDIAELWARFNRVAVSNPRAAFPTPRNATALDTPGPANRPMAFPYNKWHSSQWTVDQAAAMVCCSVAAARRFGVPPDCWVFPLVGLESSHALSLLRRRLPHAWPAMEVLGRAASRRIGRSLAEVELVEVYSCFPAAVRVQQRALGLERNGTPTVTGGMPFAGGPFNNFVLQATVAVVERLRLDADALGAVTTVSGLLTKPGLAVWSARPDGSPPLVADLAEQAASATRSVSAVPTLDAARGGATVVTYTVGYDGLDPARTVVLAALADGRRCVAFSDDPDVAARATEEELCGVAVSVRSGAFVLSD